MNKIRVLLIDDHRIFLAGLRGLLEKQEDMTMVGAAPDGPTGLQLSVELHPDVVLIDVTMPGLNGIETTRRILEQLPKTRIIALSAHSASQFVGAMLQAGAAGYVLKSNDPDELMRAVRIVAQGQYYLTPEVAGSVVDGFVKSKTEVGPTPRPELSSREREVLRLLAEGKTMSDIATILRLGRKTVESYRRRLTLKLNLSSLADLVKYAIREGLVSGDI